jgi:spherulation-specific family 4 protein
VNFTVIINPHNGPGESTLPDANYFREIQKLNAKSNVCTIGYVRVNYCRRNLEEVWQDVAKYGGWVTTSASSLGVHGIFIDETPNLYDVEQAEYLDKLSRHVKDTEGILGDRTVCYTAD